MIKWITIHEWAGLQRPGENDQESPWTSIDKRRQEYAQRLDEIRARLPPDLLKADLDLHDSELLEVRSLPQTREVQMTIRTYDGKRQRWVFEGVSDCHTINHEVGLQGPAGFGHLGYSEIDLDDSGFSIAILCSSGIEIVITASAFRLNAD